MIYHFFCSYASPAPPRPRKVSEISKVHIFLFLTFGFLCLATGIFYLISKGLSHTPPTIIGRIASSSFCRGPR